MVSPLAQLLLQMERTMKRTDEEHENLLIQALYDDDNDVLFIECVIDINV